MPQKGIDDTYPVFTYFGQSNRYALESAAWFWSKQSKTGAGNLNAYVEKNDGSLEVFFITQYFVNGYPSGANVDYDLRYIKNGGSYSINKDSAGDSISLSFNANKYPLPNGWDMWVDAYNKANEVFHKERII